MGKHSARTIRDLRLAAMDGDPAACRALLRRNGRRDLAAEIRADKPFPPRVKKAVAALTAGTNTEWEYEDADGKIINLLLD